LWHRREHRKTDVIALVVVVTVVVVVLWDRWEVRKSTCGSRSWRSWEIREVVVVGFGYWYNREIGETVVIVVEVVVGLILILWH